MSRLIMTVLCAAMCLPISSILAQGGGKARVTYATDYKTAFGARKVFREVNPDQLPVPQFYYLPTLILEHNEAGPRWYQVEQQTDGTVLLQIKMDLFNERYEALARDAVLSRLGEMKNVKLTPVPLSKMVVSWQGPDPLPDGVELKDDGVPNHSPSAKGETWIQFAVDPSVWQDDSELSMLKRHLLRSKLRIDLVYDVMDDKTNRILVTLKSDAVSKLQVALDGVSIPGTSGSAPYVTREGERIFASEVRSAMQVEYIIHDPTLFDLDFIKQIMDQQLATEIALDWAVFDEQRTKSNYHCDDVRPDVVFQKFQNEQEVTEEVRERRRKIAVASGGGFGPFSASAAAESDKKDFDSFARKHGLIGDWVGEQYIPKQLKVKQVNLAKLASLRSFSMITRSVVDATYYEPITLEIQSFVGPSEAQRVRTEADREREQLIKQHEDKLSSIKRSHQSEIEKIMREYEPKRPAPPTPQNAKLDQYEMKLLGCFQPTWNGDTEMASNKSGCQTECQTMIVFSTTEVYLFVYYVCEEVGGDHTTFAGHEIVTLYTERQGRKIVDVKCPKGWQRFNASHGKGAKQDWLRYEGLHGSGWDYLDYKVDGPDGRDYLHVGVQGKLSDNIVVVVE